MDITYKYVDLSTKIRVMKGQMLTEEDYTQMMQKKDVREVALYLKNETYYKDYLDELDVNDVHRGRLEILLYRAIVRDGLKIAKHLTGAERRFYRYVFRKLEVEDIKKMLRTLQSGHRLEDIDRSTLFISRYSRIDFNKSLAARDMKELVDSLKDTNFYHVLKPFVRENGPIDMFGCEMVLDAYYFQQSRKKFRNIAKGKNLDVLNDFFGLEADFKNIFWIFRAKKSYHLSREIMFRYLIPYYHKVTKEILTEMIDAPDMKQLIAIINRTFYGKIIDFTQNRIELQFLSYMKKEQERLIRLEPFTVAPVVAYIYLKELEVHNITNIVEGVRYRASKEEIEGYLTDIR